ncbi:MAG: DUF1203 domain-containing protein [Acidobacteriota bacterium]
MDFQIEPLDASRFDALLGASEEALREHQAVRVTAEADHGYPCRVSLADAKTGETLLLVNYEHMPLESPYRATHAVYVREHVETSVPAINEVPEMFRSRQISVRAFDAEGFLRPAEVVDGKELEASLERTLSTEDVDFVHLHFAAPGCYAARAVAVG